MLKTFTKKSVVRAFHSSWNEDDHDPMIKPGHRYRSCVTLEPSEALAAWETLSEDTVPLEFANIPRLLHYAFRRELIKRSNER